MCGYACGGGDLEERDLVLVNHDDKDVQKDKEEEDLGGDVVSNCIVFVFVTSDDRASRRSGRGRCRRVERRRRRRRGRSSSKRVAIKVVKSF